MESWFCLDEIFRSITLTGEDDALIWQHDSKGEFTTSSLYSIINFRGIKPLYISSIWSIVSPPRVNVFLWLFASIKLITKDNLLKRGIDKNPESLLL